eukprot:1184206-Prorocentrum_minimum.AAC.3
MPLRERLLRCPDSCDGAKRATHRRRCLRLRLQACLRRRCGVIEQHAWGPGGVETGDLRRLEGHPDTLLYLDENTVQHGEATPEMVRTCRAQRGH